MIYQYNVDVLKKMINFYRNRQLVEQYLYLNVVDEDNVDICGKSYNNVIGDLGNKIRETAAVIANDGHKIGGVEIDDYLYELVQSNFKVEE